LIDESLASFEMGIIIYFGDFFEICESNQLSNIRCESILGIDWEISMMVLSWFLKISSG